MARSHLTLAALATAAVGGLDVATAMSFGRANGDFDACLITTREGRHLLVRVPRTERAEAAQSTDLVGLRALSAGVRARLPFGIPTPIGQAPIDGTRAVVYEFVYGAKVALNALGSGPGSVAASIGSAIAAIHALPTGFVADAGLPTLSAGQCLQAGIEIIDRASATGLVPAALLGRWERAAQDANLWQFQPTVTNGALSTESFLSADGEVTGILGWGMLRVADPAHDLAWLGPNPAAAETAFASYLSGRGAIDRHVRQRAMFYAELEVAKWLLHGTDTRSTEIVDDAVTMLTSLVDSVRNDVMNPIGTHTMPTMAMPA